MILLLALADFYPIRGIEPKDICSISRPKTPTVWRPLMTLSQRQDGVVVTPMWTHAVLLSLSVL